MKPIYLRTQLLFYAVLVAFVPVFCLGIYYDQLTRNVIRDDGMENRQTDVAHKMDIIDQKYEQVVRFTDWICMDPDIVGIFGQIKEEAAVYDRDEAAAIDKLNEHFIYNSISDQITALFLLGSNELDIRNGVEASLIRTSIFKKEEWFQNYQTGNRVLSWGSMRENYNSMSRKTYVTPVARCINNLDTGDKQGDLILLIEEDYFADIYQDLKAGDSGQIYLLDEYGQIVSTNTPQMLSMDLKLMSFYSKIEAAVQAGRLVGNIELDNEVADQLLTYKKSRQTGWMLVEIAPFTQINEQNRLVEDKIIMSFIVLAISMWALLSLGSTYFVQPIEKLTRQVKEIANGNFNKKIIISTNRELKELGDSVNKMGDDLQILFDERVKEEEQKRALEFKLLQGQITPHFLYNTLNSIKSMAVLQRSQGIEKMTGSLGKLLKASLGQMDEKITLREEMAILEDYMYIQRIRYKGRIRFEKDIQDERLLECRVIKFIFQPIAENAIFHGIEPKEEGGILSVTIRRELDRLLIEFWDDGRGMDETQLNLLRNGGGHVASERGMGLGTQNIIQRIRLVYGPPYGLRFESEVGSYTQVTVVLPVEFDASEVKE